MRTSWHATKELVRKVIDQYLSTDDSNMRVMTIDNINLERTAWVGDMTCLPIAVWSLHSVRELYAERSAIFEAKKGKTSVRVC
ncbi:hypothetical protein ACTMU2_35645 (plasmid) [Cupriavidus basilensis]